MASIISSSQVDSFRALIREIEPYPLEVLEDLMIDDNRYDENRINATIAKKMLIDCGIPLECENPNNESDNRQTNNDHQSDQSYIERLTTPSCPVIATPEQIKELREQGYEV